MCVIDVCIHIYVAIRTHSRQSTQMASNGTQSAYLSQKKCCVFTKDVIQKVVVCQNTVRRGAEWDPGIDLTDGGRTFVTHLHCEITFRDIFSPQRRKKNLSFTS